MLFSGLFVDKQVAKLENTRLLSLDQRIQDYFSNRVWDEKSKLWQGSSAG